MLTRTVFAKAILSSLFGIAISSCNSSVQSISNPAAVKADNSITPQIVATRISGPAPLAVLFNASGSTDSSGSDSFNNLTYSFDAGDNNSATYTVSGQLKRRHSGGPLFAYVYETPSTTPYTVKVRVQNSAGQWSEAQIQITVTNPDTVFSGSNTVCVGNPIPTAGAGGCPSGALVRTSLLDGNSYSNKRVLLKRGESFGSLSIDNVATDVIVGAFGTGTAPIVSSLSIGAGAGGSTPAHPTRVAVSDLIVNGDYSGPVSGSDVLVMRLQHNASGNSFFDFGATSTSYWRSNPPGGWSASHFPEPRRLFYFENNISASGAYGALLDSALVGNTFTAQAPAQHAVRIWRAMRTFIGHNDMGRVGDNIRHSLKLHSGGTRDCTQLDTNTLLYGDCTTSKVVIANNSFGHVNNLNDWTVAIRPENTTSAQGIEDVITENNTFIRGGNTSVDLLLVGRRLSDRGNLTSASGSIISNTSGTGTNSCTGYSLTNSWCGPYYLNMPARTPNWP
ncbi:MAG: hypothetical protein A2622_07920 [Bdellovibrionales bacterium RIFCSPHIGHO2_01_FULL_40_29]|nr:MAG: hypothetical protein A2622_07920 [Bdellovibrionales bacterium RIFCSPHIGHO2_01_FULL_40_29]OFZ33732.1 MAG: hypothetical protein A3D17_10010 [Bdellovibrionales bacterium RIFCSPHIGHO2_02_FULL_40_15]